MTRLVFVDENLVILLDSDLPAPALVDAIQAGAWQPPREISALLAAGAPVFRVVNLGRLVVISPAEPVAPASRPALEDLTPLALTPRQLQVLQCLADGLTLRQIATRLRLHKRTVELHFVALKGRLCATSRMQTVLRGVALGLCKIRAEPKPAPDIGYTWPHERGPTRPHPPRKDDEERTLSDPADE